MEGNGKESATGEKRPLAGTEGNPPLAVEKDEKVEQGELKLQIRPSVDLYTMFYTMEPLTLFLELRRESH